MKANGAINGKTIFTNYMQIRANLKKLYDKIQMLQMTFKN